MARLVRRDVLLENAPVTGKNYDHRKRWIEEELQRLASGFGIDQGTRKTRYSTRPTQRGDLRGLAKQLLGEVIVFPLPAE